MPFEIVFSLVYIYKVVCKKLSQGYPGITANLKSGALIMASEKIQFNKTNLTAIVPPAKGRDTYSDKKTPGLKLRVTANGVMTFVFMAKVNGRNRNRKIGRYPTLSVEEARKEAIMTAAEYAKGNDPGKPKSNKMTFKKLFDDYMNLHSKQFKRTWKEDQRIHDTLLKKWDNKILDEIDRQTVTSLHNKITKNNGIYIANKTLALIRKVFNFAIDNLELDIRNPAAKIQLNKEQSRDRFLNQTELRNFFNALDDEQTPDVWRSFFYLALFTGARRGNLQAMRWEHIDFENGIWKISGTEFKNGKDFKCILTPPALEILRRRRRKIDSEFVFPSNSRSGHIEEPKRAWNQIIERANLTGLRLHDLRRTLGSWQAAAGTSLQIIAKSLGHKNQKTTEIYSRLDLDPVRQSVNAATAAMLKSTHDKKDGQ